MVVDSGATETVIGEEMVKAVELTESPGSKSGVVYTVANGEDIPNLGQKTFVGETEGGVQKKMTAQVTEVDRSLLSVRKMVNAGNTVVFSEEGPYIISNVTKHKIWMKDEDGMFMFSMWAKGAAPF